jgi:hypothetical protein
MKVSRMLSFTLSTFNIVWGKPAGGGATASWFVGPPVADLAPTNCTSCNVAIVRPAQPFELPPVRCARCTKVLGFPPNLSPLLDGSNVCALSHKSFLVAVEQSPPRTHGPLQALQHAGHRPMQAPQPAARGPLHAKAPFPTMVEPKAKNMPPPGVDS